MRDPGDFVQGPQQRGSKGHRKVLIQKASDGSISVVGKSLRHMILQASSLKDLMELAKVAEEMSSQISPGSSRKLAAAFVKSFERLGGSNGNDQLRGGGEDSEQLTAKFGVGVPVSPGEGHHAK